MKFFKIIFLPIIFFFCETINAQWQLRYPLIPNVPINDITFINSNEGFIINTSGSILRTTDGGINWRIVFHSQRETFSEIKFLDEYNGFVFSPTSYPGDNNNFLVTSDKGNSWNYSNINIGDAITFLPLSTTSIIKATDYPGTIQKLDNFWINWKITYSFPVFRCDDYVSPYGKIKQFQKLSNNEIFALGSNNYAKQCGIIKDSISFILVSKDLGDTWDTLWCGNKDAANTFKFYNIKIGWIGSEISNIIYKTTDGGKNWHQVYIDTLNDYSSICSIYTIDSLTIFCASSSGEIIYSNDGGDTWHQIQLMNVQYPNSKVYFLNKKHGFFTGSKFFTSKDSGKTWSPISNTFDEIITKIDFVDEKRGWAIGDNKIFFTTDGGYNWELQYSTIKNLSYAGLDMIDSLEGWAIAQNIIYHTTNGGNTWINFSLPTEYYFSRGIQFLNKVVGIIFEVRNYSNNNAYNYVTKDGGKTWELYQITNPLAPSISSFFKIKFVDGGHLYFANQQGLWISRDTARTWELNTKITTRFFTFDFLDTLNGCVPIDHEHIGFTTDGGDSWDSILLPFPVQANDIIIAGRDYFGKLITYVASINGDLLRILEGDVFSPRSINTYTDLYLNSFATYRKDNFINLWLAGYGFQVLYTNDYITSTKIDNNLISRFNINQNYPNPFNPSTTIKYEIPKESNVTIKIFDVLGRDVETLLNTYQKVGQHEVNWNAKNYSSGIYFYQIKAGNFIATKKMLLIK